MAIRRTQPSRALSISASTPAQAALAHGIMLTSRVLVAMSMPLAIVDEMLQYSFVLTALAQTIAAHGEAPAVQHLQSTGAIAA
ncbi:MAG: hypothetical protein ACREQX_07095 [Candidatus Binataceae bacterium]